MTSAHDIREVTPDDRFAAVKRQADLDYWFALDRSGEGYKLSFEQHQERLAIREARYWDTFNHSYTPQQQRAAARLLTIIGDGEIDREFPEYIAAVRGVMALIGAEK